MMVWFSGLCKNSLKLSSCEYEQQLPFYKLTGVADCKLGRGPHTMNRLPEVLCDLLQRHGASTPFVGVQSSVSHRLNREVLCGASGNNHPTHRNAAHIGTCKFWRTCKQEMSRVWRLLPS